MVRLEPFVPPSRSFTHFSPRLCCCITDVLIGDYGIVLWIDDDGVVVARAGGGGYGDFTDDEERNIYRVKSLYPFPAFTNNYDSGSDRIDGNGNRDVIFGSGGLLDEIHGNDGEDLIVTDYGVIEFDFKAPNLEGVLSIESRDCNEPVDGRNVAYGGSQDDVIIGGSASNDTIYGNEGNDLATGDCVSILFDEKFHVVNITSTFVELGSSDNITMGNGTNVAIGGYRDDFILGGDGRDILVSCVYVSAYCSIYCQCRHIYYASSLTQLFFGDFRLETMRKSCSTKARVYLNSLFGISLSLFDPSLVSTVVKIIFMQEEG